MVDKVHVLDIIHSTLDGSDKFLVDLKITTDSRIYVSIDGDNGINIDDCIELSRAIENSLDREVEDFELNVASAGLDSPLKMPRQYKKNVGRDLDVTTQDEERISGTILEADDEKVVLRPLGKKKKGEEKKDVELKYADIKTAKIMIKF